MPLRHNGGEAWDILAGCGKGGATKGETERGRESGGPRGGGGGGTIYTKRQGRTGAIVCGQPRVGEDAVT